MFPYLSVGACVEWAVVGWPKESVFLLLFVTVDAKTAPDPREMIRFPNLSVLVNGMTIGGGFVECEMVVDGCATIDSMILDLRSAKLR